jgi:hypothetical protein
MNIAHSLLKSLNREKRQIMDDDNPASPHETPWSRVRRSLSSGKRGWIVAAAAALMCAVIGVSVAYATDAPTTAASPSAPAGQAAPDGGAGPRGGGSNARSAPSAGGSVGTVSSVSASGFTMSTSTGTKVTVNGTASTAYQDGTKSTSASAVTTGTAVLVLGTTDGSTITAAQVIVQPNDGASTSSAAGVTPFERGAPSTSKEVGQIPSAYSEGSGTIVGATAANKATQAALAAYPGGVVNRVVQLSSGDYEVHNVGVSWPHHIFVNQDFTVVGAN